MLYYNMCMCMFSTFTYHYVSIVRSIEPTGILGLEINIIIIIIIGSHRLQSNAAKKNPERISHT